MDYISIQTISNEFSFRKLMLFKVLELDKEYTMIDMKIFYQPVEIYGIGENISAALLDLAENIKLLWENYALEDDEALTEDAKQLKYWLLENVEQHPIYLFAKSQTNFSSDEWKTYNQMLERKSVGTGLNIFDLY